MQLGWHPVAIVQIAFTHKQPVFVFVAVVIQRAMIMRRIVICGLPRFTLFFHFKS
jgi:hypothetical protein